MRQIFSAVGWSSTSKPTHRNPPAQESISMGVVPGIEYLVEASESPAMTRKIASPSSETCLTVMICPRSADLIGM